MTQKNEKASAANEGRHPEKKSSSDRALSVVGSSGAVNEIPFPFLKSELGKFGYTIMPRGVLWTLIKAFPDDPATLVLYLFLISKAAHSSRPVGANTLQPGQVLTSLRQLAGAIAPRGSVSQGRSQVMRALHRLEDAGLISRKRAERNPEQEAKQLSEPLQRRSSKHCGTIISVRCYDLYNAGLRESETPLETQPETVPATALETQGETKGFIQGNIETEDSPKKQRREIDEDFFPDPSTVAWCTSKYPAVDWREEVDRFISRHRSLASTFVRQDAAFRTWISNADKYRREDASKSRRSRPPSAGSSSASTSGATQLRDITERHRERRGGGDA